MTLPRSKLIHVHKSGTYHCISRCVRRAFLCGRDPVTHQNFEHRKIWIHNRMIELSGIFLIDVCGFAAMSNHLHIILRNRPDLVAKLSNEDIAIRWYRLFPKRRNQHFQPEDPTGEEVDDILARIDVADLRERLSSISWFMRCLKEHIARRANREDECTGRFWEGRFKSIALLDHAAILTCSAYVDLNPIRAGVAESPETSEFTSVYDRIRVRQVRKGNEGCASPGRKNGRHHARNRDTWLCPLMDEPNRKGYLNVPLDDYLQLLDWTGRQVTQGKKGAIPDHLESILVRLDVKPRQWLRTSQHFGSLFFRAAGKVTNMTTVAAETGRKWFRGKQSCAAIFLNGSNNQTMPTAPSIHRQQNP